MTPAELAAIRERTEKATKGPWISQEYVDLDEDGSYDLAHVTAPDPDEPATAEIGVSLGILRNDANFIAHAREDVPALLAEIERLTGLKHECNVTISDQHAQRRGLESRIVELAEERDKAKRACQTFSRVLDQQCKIALQATQSHDLLWGDDGDGDWDAIWGRVSDLGAKNSTLQARLDKVRALLVPNMYDRAAANRLLNRIREVLDGSDQ